MLVADVFGLDALDEELLHVPLADVGRQGAAHAPQISRSAPGHIGFARAADADLDVLELPARLGAGATREAG